MSNSKKYNYIDFTIFLVVFILMAISVLVVYTASSSYALTKHQDSEHFLTLHLIKIIVAVGFLILGIAVDYKNYLKFTKVALIVGIFLLVYVLFFGTKVYDTYRFINIYGFKFQPSEIVKFLLIAHLAKLLADKSYNVRDFKTGFLPLMIWIAVVAGLVMIQPSFSMGSVILCSGILLIYLGGVRFKHLLISFSVILPYLVYNIYDKAYEYKANRFTVYIKNFENMINLNIGEIIESVKNTKILGQVWQGIIAFGNGGIFGVGLGNSRQRDFYIPEAYNDFVFSIVGEEYGVIGTVGIMLLFLIIFLRGLKIANYAKDEFGRYLALGITILITFFALINAGVTLGIIPATGLPMPFISYGGSSFIASAYAIGVLLNISKQTDLNPRISHIPVVGTVNAEGKF